MHYVGPTQELVSQASGHRGSGAQRLVNAYPIVPSEVDRERVAVVLELFGEAIRQPGKAAHLHPHREILPLTKRRRNEIRMRVAKDRSFDGAKAFGRAIAAMTETLPDTPFMSHTRHGCHARA
jgi:hypothetical protein